MSLLTVCPACHRHVLIVERVCPFCVARGRVVALAAMAGVGASLQACPAPVYGPPPTPVYGPPPMSERMCEAAPEQSQLLTADWDASDRADVEIAAREGVVVLRRDGCEARLLRDCTAPGSYSFTASAAKRTSTAIQRPEALYTTLPTHAPQLERLIEREGELALDTVVVGEYRLDRAEVSRSELRGQCDGATHVVTAMGVGAFALSSGKEARHELNAAGRPESCEQSVPSEARPPATCSELVQLEVKPLAPRE